RCKADSAAPALGPGHGQRGPSGGETPFSRSPDERTVRPCVASGACGASGRKEDGCEVTLRISNQLFGTQPLATPCPGPLSAHWRRFYATVIAQPVRQCSAPDVTVITWNNGQRSQPFDKPCGALEASLQRLGIEAMVLAPNEGSWCNRDKLRLIAEALPSVTTPYVIGADSSDCLFLDSPQIAVDRFRTHFSCSLLFNGTGSRCWPELPAIVEFQQSLPLAARAQGRHWINSVFFIGEMAFCR